MRQAMEETIHGTKLSYSFCSIDATTGTLWISSKEALVNRINSFMYSGNFVTVLIELNFAICSENFYSYFFIVPDVPRKQFKISLKSRYA